MKDRTGSSKIGVNEAGPCQQIGPHLTRGRSLGVPKRNIECLDLDRLHEVLDYDPETGHLTWRVGNHGRKPGKRAGCVKSRGYRKISIDGKSYPASNLAWFHFYGVVPENLIDHKNLDKADDSIENLREATPSQNARNQGRNSANTTGFKGVAVFNKQWNRAHFRAHIRVEGRRVFLGLFHTVEEAYAAYCKKAREVHGEFARVE
jgi:hypothetical protein